MTKTGSLPALTPLQQAFRQARAFEKSADWPAAERAYDELLAQYPGYIPALLQRATVLQHLGRSQEALMALQTLIALDPLQPAAHCNLGALLAMQGDTDGAERAYQRALELKPGMPQALGNWIKLLDSTGRPGQAGRLIEAMLRQAPGNIGLRLEWARRLRLAHRHQDAVEALREVLRQDPRHVDALLELGGVLMLLGRSEAALRCLERLVRLQPQHRMGLYNLGQTLEALGRDEDALRAHLAALAVDPSATEVLCQAEYLRLGLCDWDGYDERVAHLQQRLEQRMDTQGHHALVGLTPLGLLNFPLPLALHRRLGEAWSESVSQSVRPLPPLSILPPAEDAAASRPVIRVGYLSADFGIHAMGSLIHGLFGLHDRARFEVFAYSLSHRDDAVTASVRRGVDHFLDASALDAVTLAQRIRADRLDVLIDLMGHTRQGRPEVLAMRPAPLQLLYLGYPGSMGAGFIDGVIADEWLIPPALASGYRERVYRLPCGFVWSAPAEGADTPVADPAPLFNRSTLGLPENATVYACFNRPHKLDPHTFDLWLQILMQVPGSVLWMVQESPLVQQRLNERSAAAGLATGRLVFTPKVPPEQFEALCAQADLFLDTAHYGAGATAVAALHAGLPLLTRPGETFASRMGSSLCAATGLQALICDSADSYVAKAVALGLDRGQLPGLRRQLLAQQTSLPLFRTADWVAQLESLLWQLVKAPAG